jgi:perosamine synthetase
MVGTFGDSSIFDFSQPSALCCGEGAMIVTDDTDLARTLRYLRDRQPDQRQSISISRLLPLSARISELTAALGLAQLKRIDEILARRRQVADWYLEHIRAFEGIKPPYLAPDVDEVHWFLYTVHLGTRFTRSSCAAIVEDLHTAGVEAEMYSYPLYLERYYVEQGWRKGSCLVSEKVSDRAIAMPFHAHLTEEQIEFIVKTAKDASVNVGAGAAIYL